MVKLELMQNRKLKILLIYFVFFGIIFLSFSAGFSAGQNQPKNILISGVENIGSSTPKGADFGVFWEAWQTIEENYYKNSEVSVQDKVYGAVSGLVKSLGDPYSEFFPPAEGKKFEEDIQGNFGGIGAELGIEEDRLVVISPLKDSPAARADLKAKDIILAVDSKPTQGLGINEAVQNIRGEVGSKVILTVFREGWEKPKDITITREVITIPTLEYEMKEDGIFYVNLYSFNSNSNPLFYEAMTKALSAGSKGMILDLRDNPGGFLQVAVDLAGWFMPRGTLVVSERDKSGETIKLYSTGNAALKNFPVVVLVNGGSASASEILAGALRDQRKIKLVGEKTYGKGTVQQLIPLQGDSSVKITIANWILPKGGVIEEKGIEPDYEVKITEKDFDAKKDPQFQKALEILKEEILKNKSTIFRLGDN